MLVIFSYRYACCVYKYIQWYSLLRLPVAGTSGTTKCNCGEVVSSLHTGWQRDTVPYPALTRPNPAPKLHYVRGWLALQPACLNLAAPPLGMKYEVHMTDSRDIMLTSSLFTSSVEIAANLDE